MQFFIGRRILGKNAVLAQKTANLAGHLTTPVRLRSNVILHVFLSTSPPLLYVVWYAVSNFVDKNENKAVNDSKQC